MAAALRKKDPYEKIDPKTPRDEQVRLGQALDLKHRGDLHGCAALCQTILRNVPNQPQAANMLVSCLYESGNEADAIKLARQLVEMHPKFVNAHNNLAIIARQAGNFQEAIKHFELAITHGHNDAVTYSALAHLYTDHTNMYDRALQLHQKALVLDPENTRIWHHIWSLGKKANSVSFYPECITILADVLKSTNPQTNIQIPIARTILRASLHMGEFADTIRSEAFNAEWFDGKAFQNFCKSDLFLNVMQYHVATGEDFESVAAYIRHALLQKTLDAGDDYKLLKPHLRLLSAIAKQSDSNEYVYYITQEESQRIDQIKSQLAVMDASTLDKKLGSWMLLLFASYQPLTALKCDDKLQTLYEVSSNEVLKQIIARQIIEPAEEAALKNTIPSLAPIADGVSSQVREMYEENPYPCWERLPKIEGKRSYEAFLKSLAVLRPDVAAAVPDAPKMLVAGAGTGKHVLQTYFYHNPSRMVALDLSFSSLAYAKRKALQYKAQDVEFMQGDILELDRLDEQFDVIESVGVLHHMQDPLAGWQKLINRLKPNGFMKIGLYSEIARDGVVRAREIIKNEGFQPTLEGIRECRKYLCEQPEQPDLARLKRMRDFYSTSECRDLIFHVQEHRFTCLQLKDSMDKLGLEFLGFVNLTPEDTQRYLAKFPEDKTMTHLENWHQFEQENPDLFLSMYNFHCCRKIEA